MALLIQSITIFHIHWSSKFYIPKMGESKGQGQKTEKQSTAQGKYSIDALQRIYLYLDDSIN